MRKSLTEIYKNYQIAAEDLPEAVRKLWYSNSCELDAEDQAIWLDHLSEFRGENSQLIERLCDDLNGIESWPVILTVSLPEADRLLTVMNDQRLYLAAIHNLGELEINEDWDRVFLSPEKHPLVNIHFLAWLIELIIIRLDHPAS
ncbi:MAG: hypothetical protein AAF649_09850 [Verrucomicrobiota bacterium]